MTSVVAVLGGASPAVAAVAAAVGDLLHAELRAIGPPEALHDGDAADVVLAELAHPDVRLAVLPDGAALDALGLRVIERARRPVVLVPMDPETSGPRAVSRVLLPLDGSWEAAAAVAPTAALLADAGVDLVVLHVFDRSTVPAFWDQAAHARRSWEPEFLARYCPIPGVQLHLRAGAPGEEVTTVAAEEGVDLIALGWSQHFDADQAATVRATLRAASVPVLLVPVRPDDEPGARTTG